MRTGLVDAHHARVTGDVSADYGGEASFHLPSISCAAELVDITVRGHSTEANAYKTQASRRKPDTASGNAAPFTKD
jgi:hypothetical protein